MFTQKENSYKIQTQNFVAFASTLQISIHTRSSTAKEVVTHHRHSLQAVEAG